MIYTVSLAYTLSTIIYFALSLYVWRYRDMPAGKPFAISLLIGAAWALCDVGYVLSDSYSGLVFWSSAKFLVTPFLPVSIFIMAVRYYKRSRWWDWQIIAPISIIPVLTAFFGITQNPLLTGNIWLDTTTAIPELHFHEGPFFVVHLGFSYLLSLAGLLLVVASLRDMQHIYRLQTIVLSSSMGLPMFAEGLRQIGTLPVHDPAPLFFGLSGIIQIWSFTHLRTMDLTPVAHSLVIKNMPDLMLVVDQKGRVVDINPAASTAFNTSAEEAIGRPVGVIFPQWRKLSALYAAVESARCEVALDLQDGPRVYDLSVSLLRSAKQDIAGRLLLLRDITNHDEVKQAYQRANLKLQQQLTHVAGLQETFRKQAIRDPLTGLFNRRYLEEALQYELIEAERDRNPLSVIMLDIDYFKQVNDTWGHDAGDHMLQEMGKLLVECSLDTDVVCRLGGEEFMVILPDLTAEAAFERAEAYRTACHSLYILEGPAKIACTVSLGVATYPFDGKSVQELVRAADTALYLAKAAGRNHTSILSTAMIGGNAEAKGQPYPDTREAPTTTKLVATGPIQNP